jgi:hypothetical protein
MQWTEQVTHVNRVAHVKILVVENKSKILCEDIN